MPWKVPTHIARAGTRIIGSRRARISPAALLVKVTARIDCGETPSTAISQAIR